MLAPKRLVVASSPPHDVRAPVFDFSCRGIDVSIEQLVQVSPEAQQVRAEPDDEIEDRARVSHD